MVDILILIVIACCGYFGFKRGFVKTILSFSSSVLSIILTAILLPFSAKILQRTKLAYIIRSEVYDFIEKKQNNPILLDNAADTLTNIIVNIIGFIAVIVLVKIVISVIFKLFNVFSKIPVIKQMNSLLGLVAGVASGSLICYIIIGIVDVINSNIYLDSLNNYINNSLIGIIFKENNIISEILTKII